MEASKRAKSHLLKQRDLHERIRSTILERSSSETGPVCENGPHDFAFAPDVAAEEVIEEFCGEWAGSDGPIRVVTEESDRVYPDGAAPTDARLRLIIDPVDGTRVLLHDLRSAWILSAVAEERSDGEPRLLDAAAALQTEIPTRRQPIADTLYTVAGQGAHIEQWNLQTGERLSSAQLRAPALRDPDHSFVVFSKFFPEGKGLIAWIEESILEGLRPDDRTKRSYFFEDQYLSTGGQIYCLATGRYSFVAELRPLVSRILERRGRASGIACHAHDVAALKIATEAGILFTDLDGNDFNPLMTTTEEIGFLAYANKNIRSQLEQKVQDILQMYKT